MGVADDAAIQAANVTGKLAPKAATFARGAGAVSKFGLKALGPAGAIADLGLGAYSGATANSNTRAARDEQGNIVGPGLLSDRVLDQQSATEKGIIGALTGSATVGGSVTGGLLGLEEGGNADIRLGGFEAVARGGAIGLALGGPAGGVAGAIAGGLGEGYKHWRQLSLEEDKVTEGNLRTGEMEYDLQNAREGDLEKTKSQLGLRGKLSTSNFYALRGVEQNRAMEDARLTAELRQATSLKESGGGIADFTQGMDANVAASYANMSIDDVIKQKQTRLAENKALRAKERNDATYFGLNAAQNVDSEQYQRGVDERARLYEQEFAATKTAPQQAPVLPQQAPAPPQVMAAQQQVREVAQAATMPVNATGELSTDKLSDSADKLAKLAGLIDSMQAAREANQPLKLSPEQAVRDRAAAPLSTEGSAAQQPQLGLDLSILERLTASLDKFNKDFSTNIDRLNETQIKITLDATNVNVNLNGADVLSRLTESVQQTIMETVTSELGKYKVVNGKLTKDTGVLGK